MRTSQIVSAMLIASFLSSSPAICRSQTDGISEMARTSHRSTPGGSVFGTVFDSLHARPLENAEVLVEGSAITVTHTDASGKFSTDPLPEGKYRVGISHPYLDSLGIVLISPDFLVVKDSVTDLRLAVPSAKGLIKTRCNASPGVDTLSALFGRIESDESNGPTPGAEVALTWTTYQISKIGGLENTPNVKRDTTAANGSYRFCGLPNDLTAKLEIRVLGRLRSVSTVAIPDSGTRIVVKNFVLPVAAHLDAQAGVITGRVELPAGQPAEGSAVEIVSTGQATLTDDRGKFTLDGVPPGSHTLRVRLLGFQEDSLTLDVGIAGKQDVIVKLKETVALLTPVNVSAASRERTLDRVGFSQRSQHSVGHFLTGEQIAHKSDFQFTDLLRGIPGLDVGVDKYGEDVVRSGRAGGSLLNNTHGCVQYFVDGQPWGNAALESMGTGRPQDSTADRMLARIAIESARQINAVLKKSDVLGIEVYQGGGAPTYFNQGGHNCATIVVWTVASLRQ
jgi:hypothetical protein